MHHGGILEKRAYFQEHSIYILLAFGSSSFVHANEKKLLLLLLFIPIIVVILISNKHQIMIVYTLKIVSNHCHISTCVCAI